jgi:2',3'-cyclic-nucleotide 2'-phosphodiesterase (5'-nucleotidase family)
MALKYIKFIALILGFLSCNEAITTESTDSQRLKIDNNLKSNSEIDSVIRPYRIRLEASMNEVLSYSDNEYKKTEGALNTAIGNLMADAVFEQSSPIFKKRYNLDLDLVLLNHGGIRAPLPKGPIFTKTAFNIMPFENKVVVAQLKGNVVMELVDYLIKAKRAHPISGMTLHITKKGKVKKLEIQGKTIDLNKIYNVATSDYLFNGGDRMEFFKKNKTVFDLDYKIRAILIDYFSAQDNLNPKRDQRFIYTN